MSNQFFEKPILNSPCGYPRRHWELDAEGQATQRIIESRRRAEFIIPIPKARNQKGGNQDSLLFDDGLSPQDQAFAHKAIINVVRQKIDNSDSARPFAKPQSGRIMAKVINTWGMR